MLSTLECFNFNYTSAAVTSESWVDKDNAFVWHPYSAVNTSTPIFPVVHANGVRLTLADGRELIDGMASWWCMIHGYNHPTLNQALKHQIEQMSHVMFGGLTHQPAVELAEQLIAITPALLQTVFFADSGSVAVEVAMKMAIQYWHSRQQPTKNRFLTVRQGYHGDTFGAMSVCDPVTGMHGLFSDTLTQQWFAAKPACRFGEPCSDADIAEMAQLLAEHHDHIAAVIIEPIVQGAGGMWFYSAEYLAKLRRLCDQYQTLLILDEIATGFGRTGKLFACEHAHISPDILCLGKALTGGYLTLSAVLTTQHISGSISQGNPGVFMHGPTFMANPLACAAALSSIQILLASPWKNRIAQIEAGLRQGLEPCRSHAHVVDVRVLGAIGVVELIAPVDMAIVQPAFVEAGVWVRPFGRLVYLMPPYIIQTEDLATLTHAVCEVVAHLSDPA